MINSKEMQELSFKAEKNELKNSQQTIEHMYLIFTRYNDIIISSGLYVVINDIDKQ